MLFIILILLILVIAAVIFARRKPITVIDRWQTFYDGIQISTSEFYNLVKQGVQANHVPKVTIGEESFVEQHIFSAKRLYLRLSQNEYVYYVCCAPYGTGTFFSSWLCVKDEKIVNKIPVVSKLAGKDRGNKTFYQRDTEAMFRMAVHDIVTDTVDSLGTAKGRRGMTELERQRVH